MVYLGKDSYIYWGYNSDAGTSAGEPGTDQNIPFNPIESLPENMEPKYTDEVKKTMDSLRPKYIYTKEKTPSEFTIETSYRDPFLMAAFFPNRAVSWTNPYTITGDFTANTDDDLLWIQLHIHDAESTDHLNRLYEQVIPMTYEWSFEPGGLLVERATFKCLDWSTNTQAMSCNNNFHDLSFGTAVGGWGAWDTSGCGSTGKRSSTNMVIKWDTTSNLGTVATAASISGIDLENLTLTIDRSKASKQIASSLTHTKYWDETLEFTCTLSGLLNSLDEIEEFEKTFCNRTTTNDLRIWYDTTANYEKYITCTNVYIDPQESTFPGIPESGNPIEYTLVFKGGVDSLPSFSCSFDASKVKGTQDPSALVYEA